MGAEELKTEEETSAKITVTKAAEKAVSEVVLRVNDGFDAGRVNRQDVASWILLKFKETFGIEEIGHIRAIHIDEIAFLESLLKKAKESGKVPTQVRELLRLHIGNDLASKKNKKVLFAEGINDTSLVRTSEGITKDAV